MDGTRRVIILGSTGSIGVQTLEVIEHLNRLHARRIFPVRYEVVGLAAGKNAALLAEQARRHSVPNVALAEPDARDVSFRGVNLRAGPDAAEQLVTEVDSDLVVAAMVGVAGLPATLAAIDRGVDVALANKETLVAAGELVVGRALASGSALLPVDSEHSGVWQCLVGIRAGSARSHAGGPAAPHAETSRLRSEIAPPFTAPSFITRITLTASGGPFRDWPGDRIESATPEQALEHPTWRMGRKVTIDSASLMNKALELIEARWLFGLPPDRLGAVIHTQSIVHSIVELADGSNLLQAGAPDMRTPIQIALSHPHRVEGLAAAIDWAKAGRLDFAPVDPARFPALSLARRVLELGGAAGAVLNAANEEAVLAFLDRRIPFGRIAPLAAEALDRLRPGPLPDLPAVIATDAAARQFVRERLGK